ncbi:flagellar motility protein MotE (MotC chaperone) [Litoreibacter meonggei]|uniref:Flagellar motility protein MotE (MotC chaperone) n=1 Tax=Litoreibacter meonggei TaxID=1049199 RepID=A0A497VCI4_9RHOB|nr:hypothetical protein [Litoreibacter meonggei]RLJ41180.1 flagellar motility protein MotE (MotC chaperone) [Litoreibacter meonggei]
MKATQKGRSPRGILAFVVAMLLLSGSLRLGSIGIAVASSTTDVDPKLGNVEAVSECVTDAETHELMELLKARSEQISALEAEQEKRQIELANAEATILENLSRVEEAETRLSQTIQRVDGASSKDVNKLTSVYESMKPKDAALLFEQMSPDFAAGFLAQMSPSAAAGILSGLTSEKAYTVSVVLAGRNANAPKQ